MKFRKHVLVFAIAIFNLFMLIFPEEILSAVNFGLKIWFTNVLPALLPFIIGTNLLIGLGVIDSIGRILQRFMYSIFKLPGCSAFALVLGFVSGYPVGAKVTSQLRTENKLSRNEAQRLIAFTNNAGPLFMLGTIGTSMLHNKTIGYIIMLSHYTAALLLGYVLKFSECKRVSHMTVQICSRQSSFGIGKLFSDSVSDAIETVLQIGGFIILFSVTSKILLLSHIIDYSWQIFNWGMNFETYKGICLGIIEMTNGARILTTGELTPIKFIGLIGIVSFGGVSVQMQSLSFIAKTDINPKIYLLGKILHAILAMIIGLLFLWVI